MLQPQRTGLTSFDQHQLADLRQRPSATSLPLDGKEGSESSSSGLSPCGRLIARRANSQANFSAYLTRLSVVLASTVIIWSLLRRLNCPAVTWVANMA